MSGKVGKDETSAIDRTQSPSRLPHVATVWATLAPPGRGRLVGFGQDTKARATLLYPRESPHPCVQPNLLSVASRQSLSAYRAPPERQPSHLPEFYRIQEVTPAARQAASARRSSSQPQP